MLPDWEDWHGLHYKYQEAQVFASLMGFHVKRKKPEPTRTRISCLHDIKWSVYHKNTHTRQYHLSAIQSLNGLKLK